MSKRKLDPLVEKKYLQYCNKYPNCVNHTYEISEDGKYFIASTNLTESNPEKALEAIKGTEEILNVTYKGLRIIKNTYIYTFEFNE